MEPGNAHAISFVHQNVPTPALETNRGHRHVAGALQVVFAKLSGHTGADLPAQEALYRVTSPRRSMFSPRLTFIGPQLPAFVTAF